MKIPVLGLFIALACLLQMDVHAESNPDEIARKAGDLFKKGDYNGLESLVRDIKKKGYDIRETRPELSAFYSAFGMVGELDEQRWEDRRKKLDEWSKACPDSLSAKLAMADWYVGYGWKARGTEYADKVTTEGWKLLAERLKKADQILKAIPPEKVDDPKYYFIWLNICAGKHSPQQLELYFKKGVEQSKEFYLLYSTRAYYLLPRWYGKQGDWEKFAISAAGTFPAEKSDIFYAHLVRNQARFYDEAFFGDCEVDYEKVKRGYLAESVVDAGNLCYLAAIEGDSETAIKLFLDIGNCPNIPAFGTFDKFLMLRRKCGAQAYLDKQSDAEWAGKLDEAEKLQVSFATDPKTNEPLSYFYMRQGMVDKYHGMKIVQYGKTMVENLDADTSNATPEQLFLQSLVCPMFGQWDRAETAAQRFDQIRPWNLTGKNTLLLCAIHKGDKAKMEAVRKMVIEMKTDRASYKMAQSTLNGTAMWDQIRGTLKSDQYLTHAAMTVAFYYLSESKPDLVRRVLEDTLPYVNNESCEKAMMESLLHGSLSRTFLSK